MDNQSAEPTTTILDILGRRTAAVQYGDILPHGVTLIRTAFVDTLGVALAGAAFEGVRIARQALSVPTGDVGGSLILGTRDRTGALDAGLLNGIAAHALDYDDNNGFMGGHPSAILVPAILALAEERDASLKDAAVAYAAGFEAIVRLARGLNPAHYEKGWHPTSTIGVFGASAAAARLLGLDGDRTAVALAIAASFASGVKANFGTMTKSLHVGHAVRDGLVSAKLAAGGYTANRAAIEAAQGFLNVYNGVGASQAQRIVERLDAELAVNKGVNPIKSFPCCASTHSTIAAALQMRRAHHLSADAVETVDVVVDRNRLPHTDRPHLEDALAGKFSLQYIVARALNDGRVGLDHFEGDAHLDPPVADLMKRVVVRAAPPDDKSHAFAADVTVVTRQGQKLHAFADGAANPGTEAGEPVGLWEKFGDCAGRVLAPARVAALTKALRDFPASGSVRNLVALAAAGSDDGADCTSTVRPHRASCPAEESLTMANYALVHGGAYWRKG